VRSGRLVFLLLHERFGALGDFLLRNVFLVGGDRPAVTGRIGHGAAAVAIEHVHRFHDRLAAGLDRLLKNIRSKVNGRSRRRPIRKVRSQVLVKTFADWENVESGHLEIDFVAHCGGTLVGSFIHSFVITDVASGWTEATPLLVREQSLVVEGLDVLRGQLPVPLLGINSDNDSAFINESLITYCTEQKIAFTRSRPYRKNDQAWIEQKNGAVIRRFVGYARYSGPVAGQTLANLYQNLRLYVNYFQPSFKLLSKHREGSKVKKSYAKPATPCDRLIADPRVQSHLKKY